MLSFFMKRKNLGQHFLVDTKIIDNEIRFAQLQKKDVVLEIGPGKGALTFPLSKSVSKVIAIEKDLELVNYLKNNLPKNVMLIHADAVKYDFHKLPNFSKIVSNLPYQISSPITFKFFDYSFEKAILMYQKEFAERMVASPGSKDYSRLSVGVYYHVHCRILRYVSKQAFNPKPLIDSCLVEIIPRKNPPFIVNDYAFFFDMVNKFFNHRRKKIKTIIKSEYNIEISDISFRDYRVETLTPEQIGTLSNEIFQKIK